MKISDKITEMSQRLGEGVRPEIFEWMLSNFKPVAYEFHGRVICTECAHHFNADKMNIDGTIVCPNCGKVLKVEHTTKKTYTMSKFMMVTQEFEDWQVFRYFWVEKNLDWNNYAGKFGARQGCYEAMQKWLSKDGSVYFMSRKLKMFPNKQYNPFRLDTDMKFRRRVSSPYCYYDPTDLGYEYMKVISMTKWMKQLGLNGSRNGNKHHGFYIDDLAEGIIKEPIFEAMYKAKQYDMIRLLNHRRFLRAGGEKLLEEHRAALKIAVRHHYFDSFEGNVKEVQGKLSDWMDLVDQVIKLGLDYRNPHYVCPKDMYGDHIYYTKKLREMDEAEARERSIEKAKEKEGDYIKARECFFPLEIKDDVLTIKVLRNVQSFAVEGKVLHHCVFDCNYFDMHRKPDSLILSARIGDDWDNPDEYVETIEVNLTDYSIVQSRGLMNNPSKYHSRIMRLVYSNMEKIMDCEKNGEKRKKVKAA